jgi:hypothetical protein
MGGREHLSVVGTTLSVVLCVVGICKFIYLSIGSIYCDGTLEGRILYTPCNNTTDHRELQNAFIFIAVFGVTRF